MATEKNLSVQLGETWSLEFAGIGESLADAELDLQIADGDTEKLSLSDAISPNPFALNSPDVDGVATVEPGDQLDLEPAVYNYEVRATLADGRIAVLQFGRLVVGASLFAWPEPSA